MDLKIWLEWWVPPLSTQSKPVYSVANWCDAGWERPSENRVAPAAKFASVGRPFMIGAQV